MTIKVSTRFHPILALYYLVIPSEAEEPALACSSPKLNPPFRKIPPSDTPDRKAPATVDTSEKQGRSAPTGRERRPSHDPILFAGTGRNPRIAQRAFDLRPRQKKSLAQNNKM
jgi:hypothetical protein